MLLARSDFAREIYNDVFDFEHLISPSQCKICPTLLQDSLKVIQSEFSTRA